MLKLLVVLLAVLLSCTDAPTGRDVTPAEVASMLRNNPDVVLVDVRTPAEYAEGHIRDSRLIDYYDRRFATTIQSLPRDVDVVLYCRSGRRSADAKHMLDSMGYTHVMNMAGGIVAWQANHFPVEQ